MGRHATRELVSLWNFHNGFRLRRLCIVCTATQGAGERGGAARLAGTGFIMEIP